MLGDKKQEIHQKEELEDEFEEKDKARTIVLKYVNKDFKNKY